MNNGARNADKPLDYIYLYWLKIITICKKNNQKICWVSITDHLPPTCRQQGLRKVGELRMTQYSLSKCWASISDHMTLPPWLPFWTIYIPTGAATSWKRNIHHQMFGTTIYSLIITQELITRCLNQERLWMIQVILKWESLCHLPHALLLPVNDNFFPSFTCLHYQERDLSIIVY